MHFADCLGHFLLVKVHFNIFWLYTCISHAIWLHFLLVNAIFPLVHVRFPSTVQYIVRINAHFPCYLRHPLLVNVHFTRYFVVFYFCSVFYFWYMIYLYPLHIAC